MKHSVFAAGISILFLLSLTGAGQGGRFNNAGSGGLLLASLTSPEGTAPGSLRPYQDKKEETATNAAEHQSAASTAAKTATGLSLADILGILFFLALVVTHFCFCRKGVYPESLPLCDISSRRVKKLLKPDSKADR